MQTTQIHNIIRLFILICLSTITLMASAQENFHSGYIINKSNDTIHGYISQVNTNVFQKCLFKKMPNDELIKYSPEDIRAYRIDESGKFYISKQVPLETGKKRCFLEFLIQGKASMYFMRDDMDHYFAETENDTIMELSERPKLTKNDWGTIYYKQPIFHGRLKYMLKDCPTIHSHIDRLKLQPRELIKLAKEYHDKVCTSEQCIIFERKIAPLKVHVGIVAGISLNNFSFGTLSRTDYRISPMVGCKLEFENLFYSAEQSTISTGLLLQKYSNYSESQYQYGNFTNFISKKDIDVKVLALKLPIIYNYTFSLSKIRPYVGAGILNTFILDQNKSLSGNFLISEGETFPFYQLGFIGVAGIKYKLKNENSINLELNFEYNKDLFVDKLTSITNKGLSLVVGYSF